MTENADKPLPDAYAKALSLLVRREHSARELKSKLAQRGLDPDEANAAVEKLQAKDFQNDTRFAELLIRTRLEGGYGARWIIAELRTHGVSEACARELIEASQPDWFELAQRQLRRRYGSRSPKNIAERAKQHGFLLRRGFEGGTAKLAVQAQGLDTAIHGTD